MSEMKTLHITAVLVGLMMAMGAGCSAITDFDDVPESEGLYSVRSNLGNPVAVTIDDDNVGTFALRFENALPEAEGGDEALVALLGDAIDLQVQNEDGITVYLSDGSYLAASETPDEEGEWSIGPVNNNRTVVNLTFFNLVEGRSLYDGRAYSATIDIAANDYFAEENVERDVTVSGPTE
jgi:hypothetical protein